MLSKICVWKSGMIIGNFQREIAYNELGVMKCEFPPRGSSAILLQNAGKFQRKAT